MITFQNIDFRKPIEIGDFVVDQFINEGITKSNLFLVLEVYKNNKMLVYCPNNKRLSRIELDNQFKKVVFVSDDYITTVASALKEGKHEV